MLIRPSSLFHYKHSSCFLKNADQSNADMAVLGTDDYMPVRKLLMGRKQRKGEIIKCKFILKKIYAKLFGWKMKPKGQVVLLLISSS